jgi:hypothetical protein
MDDTLVERANSVKKAVELGKDNFVATKREYEIAQRQFKETLAEVKKKYGIDSYESLQKAVEELAVKISADLESTEALLLEANISIEGGVNAL